MLRVNFPLDPSEGEIELATAVRGGPAAFRHSAWNVRYRDLFHNAQRYFVAVEPSEADVLFYPRMYEGKRAEMQAIALARSLGKPIVFLRTGDWHDAIRLPYGVVYRHAIFASRRVPGEYAMPALCEDMLLRTDGAVSVRAKGPKPRVGFRGYVGRRRMHLAYRLMGRRQKAIGLEIRAQLLERLARSSDLETDFVKNDRFMGATAGVLNPNREIAARVRGDYVDNIVGSDYTLCVRGAGNFSYRFYEVLSAGRIPVYIDTDGVLPYEGEVDWKRHCVWVEGRHIDRAADKILEFHAALSDAEFEALQQRNRILWEEYLAPLAFYRRALAKAVDGQPMSRSQ